MKLGTRMLILVSICLPISSLSTEARFDASLCADSFDKSMVRDYYNKLQSAAPPSIASRDLALVESKIVSGLPPSQAVGAVSNRERYEQIWQTIDSWGAENTISIVVTVDGIHAFSFPSKVPVTAAHDHGGFYNSYANEGHGLRAHINPDLVSMVYAVKLAAAEGSFLRAVNFYDSYGDLIWGLYATEPNKARAEQVSTGFARTWETIASLPRACKK